MTANLLLAILAGILVACGVYLLLERSLTRILLGVMLASNGVNMLFLVSAGKPGGPPIIGLGDPETTSDPLPQAMVLTAIVITMAVAAFVLTMAYRSFQLHGHDEVADDVEDARIRELAQADVTSESYEDTTFSDSGINVVSE
ncbi:MAG TPA: Na(+)/H(+) antiporter subunit C [Tessaracoccus flavescens]|uniref:Na(+)/H(+) antiporter subunit C n=1 Tax=Tessaracoccus flavescens TaxID=399497 RepID=A0A921JQY7_9ACTN|nr:Na(+)/H(+) antiporter subunit C [Tessaracoccus flavescens]